MIPPVIARSSGRAWPASRLAGAVIATVALLGSLLVASPANAVGGVGSASAVEAAAEMVGSGIVKAAAGPVVGFNAENIISDTLFYDGAAMSAAEIQAFLDAKIGTCSNGKCLNVLSVGISSRAAVSSQSTGNLICAAIEGGTMKVSEVIYRAQVACGISAKVILVTLQKEQGLTTSKAPSDRALSAAMGASCPDTAPCDPAFAGLGPQIIKGTQQLKTYKAARFAKQPGVNYIGYNPSESCGGTYLNIQNYATAALYSYTPYQPNAAALAAGYGLGNACSSYGNRNFYNYYTDWFGSTTIATHGAIANVWEANGGLTGWIGGPVEAMVADTANGGGWYQRFANATIYYAQNGWSAVLKSASLINATYEGSGRVGGPYGWPVSGEVCGRTGCAVEFQNGTLVWSNQTGAVLPVTGTIRWVWKASGGVDSSLRAPEAPETFVPDNGGGWTQTFLGGRVYVKAGGAVTTFAAGTGLLGRYLATGGPSGPLGWPTSNETCAAGVGCAVTYDGGTLSWDLATGRIHTISGLFAQAWAEGGGPANWIGTATSEMTAVVGGWKQEFRNGTYYLKAGGTLIGWKRVSALHDQYRTRGAESGILGWPTSGEVCGSGVCMVTFENGNLSWDAATGAIGAVSGPIATAWRDAGGPTGWFGPPQSDATSQAGGQSQVFRNATLYAKTGGPVVFHKADSLLAATYRAMGGPAGDLGWPTAGESCGDGACTLPFERGTLVWTAATGAISRR